jgi:hypothetical protein
MEKAKRLNYICMLGPMIRPKTQDSSGAHILSGNLGDIYARDNPFSRK